MTCRRCNGNHRGWERCQTVTNDADLVANKSLVANIGPKVVANKSRSKDRHKDKDARRIYQRDLMRRLRAAHNVSGRS